MTRYTTRYTLLDPITGVSKTLSKIRLTLSLELNAILLEDGEHVGIITHRDLVTFCRWCADQVLSRCQTVLPEAHAALVFVDQWLVDPKSVSNEELTQAAKAAYAAARAARAAYAAARAARAATRAAEAVLAANAANAARAATRVAEAAGVSYEVQAQWLVEHLRSAQ